MTADQSEETYFERVDRYREEEVQPAVRRCYDDLIARGCTARVAAATLRYLCGQYGAGPSRSQRAVAADFDTTPVSIRIRGRDIEDCVREALSERATDPEEQTNE